MISNIITIQELETLETVRHFSDKEALSKGYVSEATLLSQKFKRLPKSYKQVQTLVTGPKGKHTTLQTRLFREIKLKTYISPKRYYYELQINPDYVRILRKITRPKTYYSDDKTGTLYTIPNIDNQYSGKCLSSSQLSIV